MNTELKPDKSIIEDHLRKLFQHTDSSNRFEIRCLHPTNPPRKQVFRTHEFTNAAKYAEAANCLQYNVYVTPNLLKPNVTAPAKDTDVEFAAWQWIDIDGTDDPQLLIDKSDFPPSLIVLTGSIPTTRLHAYWLMNENVDLSTWTTTQKGLIAKFNSDPTIHNPSRIMRLAGTVSYPDQKKQDRGYIPELVTLISEQATAIDVQAFQEVYQAPHKPELPAVLAPLEWPQEDTTDGCVPLEVISQALDAIPPVIVQGHRNDWLAMAMAAKAANPAARHIFDQWQRQSPRYSGEDARVWDTIHPASGSYLTLFSEARNNDPDWWRGKNLNVELWWCKRCAELFGSSEQPTVKTDPAPTAKRGKFQRLTRTQIINQPAPEFLIPDLIFERQISMFYGAPRSLKSFLMLAIASTLTQGMNWIDIEGDALPLEKRRVIYVAGEGGAMFGLRTRAWFKHHGLAISDDGFEVVKMPVNLTDKEEVAAFLIDMLEDAENIGWLIIDTLSTCIPGANESASEVMTAAISSVKRISETLDCHVSVIAHEGKDASRGARGHSSQLGDFDTYGRISRNGNDMSIRLTLEKQKDGLDGIQFHFVAHDVKLSITDRKGKERTSLALTQVTSEERKNIDDSTQRADLISIASHMEDKQVLSLSQAATLVQQAWCVGHKQAQNRLKNAIPIEWVKTRTTADEVAELRRVVVSDKKVNIEMRLITSQTR